MFKFSAPITAPIAPRFLPADRDIAKSEVPLVTDPDKPDWPWEQEHVWGTPEDDIFSGGRHNTENTPTVYHGGAGRDTVDYSAYSNDPGDALNLSLQLGISLKTTGRSKGDTYDSIENIIGTRWDDVIVGSDNLIGNTLDGGQGRDILFGEGGADLMIGGGAPDIQWGGAGDDTFRFFYYDSFSYLTPDVIKDFDQNGDDVLEFVFDNPAAATWRAETWVHKGAEGTMVYGTEEIGSGPQDRFAVFLEGTDVDMVGADDFLFI